MPTPYCLRLSASDCTHTAAQTDVDDVEREVDIERAILATNGSGLGLLKEQYRRVSFDNTFVEK